MAGTNYGAYIPTSNVWDVGEVQQSNISPELKELLVRMYQNLNLMSTSINTRDAGIYGTNEFINGQTFFPNALVSSRSYSSPNRRQVYRKVINFGALPNTATKNVRHGIGDPIAGCNAGFTFTRIYGCASNTAGLLYIPLPYASSVDIAHNIELHVSGAAAPNDFVTVITGADYSAYTTCYIVLEYLKN
jgi:hypothetical protein